MQACLCSSATLGLHCCAERVLTAGWFGRQGPHFVVEGDSQGPVWVHLLFLPGNLYPLPILSFSLRKEGGPCQAHMLLHILSEGVLQRLTPGELETVLAQEKRPTLS